MAGWVEPEQGDHRFRLESLSVVQSLQFRPLIKQCGVYMYLRILSLILGFSIGFSTLAEDKIDLTLASKNPASPEFLFASQRGYFPQSAQAAYVNHVLIGAYLQYKEDPNIKGNTAYFDTLMRDRFNEALIKVKGVSYRDGYTEALLKSGLVALSAFATKGKVTLSPLTNLLVEKGLDRMAAPAVVPQLQFDVVTGTNIYMLQNLGGHDLLAKYMRKTAVTFFPELNLRQDLKYEPSVVRASMERENQKTLGGLGLGLNQWGGKIVNNQQAQSAVISQISVGMDEQTGLLQELVRTSNTQRDAEFERQQLEKNRAELIGYFGIASALAGVAGNPQAGAFFDQAGRFSAAVFDAANNSLSFSENPAAYANAYLTAVQIGVSLFASQKSDPRWSALFSGLKRIMQQIRTVQEQLVTLGEFMERRFNLLDQTLQKYVHESTGYFRQVVNSGQRNETDGQYFTQVLNQLRQETYASAVLTANLAWIQLQHNCFPQKKALDQDTFRMCRDEIGLFALTGAPLQNSASPSKSEIVASVMKRLNPQLNVSGFSTTSPAMTDPAVWLSATHTLMALAGYNPRYASLLHEQDSSGLNSFSLEKIIQVGADFQKTMRQMALAVSLSGYRLRRDLLDGIMSSYQTAVENALNYTKDLPQKYMRGTPNPNKPLAEQQPPTNLNLYPFMTAPLGFCDPNGKIEYNFSDSRGLWPSQQSTQDFMNKKWRDRPDDVKLPANFIEQIPKSVRFAMTSGFADSDQADLKVWTCFRSISVFDNLVPNNITFIDASSTAKFSAEIEVRANYNFYGKKKELVLMRLKGSRLYSVNELGMGGGYFDRSWLYYAWNGIVPPVPRMTPTSLLPFEKQGAIKDYFKGVFNHVTYEGLAEFEKDFNTALASVHRHVSDEIQNNFQSFNSATQRAREELAFVLERGLDNDQPSVQELLKFISNPQNLPDAWVWAKTQYEHAAPKGTMEAILEDKLANLARLLDAVEQSSNLKPAPDLFAQRLKELSQLLNGK